MIITMITHQIIRIDFTPKEIQTLWRDIDSKSIEHTDTMHAFMDAAHDALALLEMDGCE